MPRKKTGFSGWVRSISEVPRTIKRVGLGVAALMLTVLAAFAGVGAATTRASTSRRGMNRSREGLIIVSNADAGYWGGDASRQGPAQFWSAGSGLASSTFLSSVERSLLARGFKANPLMPKDRACSSEIMLL